MTIQDVPSDLFKTNYLRMKQINMKGIVLLILCFLYCWCITSLVFVNVLKTTALFNL